MSLVGNSEKEKEMLSQIMEDQKGSNNSNSNKRVQFRELGLTESEIMGFEYRISDVVNNISNK